MLRRLSPRPALALAATLALTSFAGAQTFRGALSGNVADATGAAIPDATLTLTNPATAEVLTIKANASGDFNFPELNVGTYKLAVTAPGFQVKNYDDVNILISKVTTLRVELPVGSESTTIDVKADAVQTDTTSTSLVAVIDSKQIQEVPLNGRNYTQLVTLSAGVNLSGSVNGTRANSINYQLDGVDNNDPWSNAVASNQGGVAGIAGGLVPIEAIDQSSMQNNATAEMGRDPGANSNLVLKSGTNRIHGDVFYFDRNEYFAALSAVQLQGTRKPEIRNHQGGFTLGGPLWRDHTFLFLAGEIQIANANNSVGDTVLSDAWISSAQQYLGRYNLQPNQVSLNLYNTLFPAASKGGTATTGNYLSNGRNSYNSYNGVIKLDHHFSDRELLSLRYLGTTGTQTADVGSHYADYFQRAPMHIHNFSAILNSTLKSNLVNQVIFGAGYFLQTFNDANQNFNTQATGLNLGLSGFLAQGATKLSVTGFDYTGATAPLGRTDVTGQVTDNLHWTVGHHNFNFGGEYRHMNLNVGYYTNGRGAFTFDGSRGPWNAPAGSSPAQIAAAAAAATSNCNALGFTTTSQCSALKNVADFLNGQPTNSSGALILRNNPQRVYLVNAIEGWAADNWQVTRQLTLNYGVRYSYPGVVEDDRKSLYNFDPTVGSGFTPIPLYNRDLSNAAPRVGFAYTPYRDNSSTVLRGSYGWFYIQPAVGQFVYNNIGNTGATGIYSNPAGSTPVFQPSVTNVTFTPGNSIFPSVLSPTNTVGAFSINKNFRTGYVQNFNLNVEQQLSKNTLLTVAYVGSLGRRLSLVYDINQPIGAVAAGSASNSNRPFYSRFPTLTAINQVNSAGTSNYHSMQLSLRQATWHGISANAYYTWSRSMDFVSTATTPMNSYNLRADYGPSTFDTRHVFTGFAQYDIPQLGRFAPRLTRGWQLNALYIFQTGTPINPLVGTNVSGTAENKDRPNVVVGAPVYTPHTELTTRTSSARTYRYLALGAFAAPTSGYGNARRDSLYGPGFGDVDISLFKHTPITEKVMSELRAEMYNVANRANFANPSATLSSSTYGILTQTRNGSSAPGLGQGEPFNVQFALKLTF